MQFCQSYQFPAKFLAVPLWRRGSGIAVGFLAAMPESQKSIKISPSRWEEQVKIHLTGLLDPVRPAGFDERVIYYTAFHHLKHRSNIPVGVCFDFVCKKWPDVA